MSCIVPFDSPWRWRKSSPAWVSTSTSALPTPTTSSSATSPLPRLRAADRKVLADEQIEAPARRQRKCRRAGDHCALEQGRALACALAADGRDQSAQHVLGGGHVLQEVGNHRLHRDRVVA